MILTKLECVNCGKTVKKFRRKIDGEDVKDEHYCIECTLSSNWEDSHE